MPTMYIVIDKNNNLYWIQESFLCEIGDGGEIHGGTGPCNLPHYNPGDDENLSKKEQRRINKIRKELHEIRVLAKIDPFEEYGGLKLKNTKPVYDKNGMLDPDFECSTVEY